MVDSFLKRPVLSTVFSIIIFLVGLLGLVSLPITLFPEIAPPMVQVTTNYVGANSPTVLKSVIAPLEEQINGVENMTYIMSTAGNDGSATIKVYFELGTDPDMASVNVQNRVSAATSKLPTEVNQYGVTTEKKFNSMLMMICMYSDKEEYDNTFVENYARITLYPMLQRVHGVGKVSVFGMRDYSIRVWLKPDKLAVFGLNPSDVMAAIQEQNIEAAPGQVGKDNDETYSYTLTYKGKFIEPKQYEDIVIKALEGGQILRIKDVADVELGAFDYGVISKVNQKSAMSMAIYQMAGSNAHEISRDIKVVIEKESKNFPDGLHYVIPYNTDNFLTASIEQVVHTFVEAFILVFIVVFIFLQDLKSTLIPGIASLVAIVGTFFFLSLIGFSLNMLTLFALVLAIGMVVDDAIVVVEAVHSKLEQGETNVMKATQEAMHEITAAIISITLVMSAVFIPVTFMSGPVGMFYKQFALTLAISIVISAINALTLSPVLCTIFIKPHKHSQKKSFFRRLGDNFNTGFDAVTKKYKHSVDFLSRKKSIVVIALLFFATVLYVCMKVIPTGFIPTEDQGVIFVDLKLPDGSSVERSDQVMAKIYEACKDIDDIESFVTIAGCSMLSDANGGSHGMGLITLKQDMKERRSLFELMPILMKRVSTIKDGTIILFPPPTVTGFSMSSGFEIQLQDRAGHSVEEFAQTTKQFIAALNARPEMSYATTQFTASLPEYEFTVDVDKCKIMGVAINDVFQTLQIYFGSSQASDFNRFTKYYRVMVQAIPYDRNGLSSVSKMMVRNNAGEMVPLNAMVYFKRVFGPESLQRFNLFTSATINGEQTADYSSGDALRIVEEEVAKLPQGYSLEYSGMTREESGSGSQSAIIFVLCFIFVYLILSAQYESYILPWSVMLSLVVGISGVFFVVWLVGMTNNIYVQVSLIMLIGLLAKNAILIVEFAVQRRQSGMGIIEAAVEGAAARLRPILMTSFAFIFGMLPLISATGAGAIGNMSIGIAAAAGMTVGTTFGIFVIPCLFVIFRTIDEKVTPSKVPTTNSEE